MGGWKIIFALASAAGVGWAIAAGTDDTAVGIAIGAGVYAAMMATGGSSRGCTPAPKEEAAIRHERR